MSRTIGILALLVLAAVSLMGTVPLQRGVPPQPFNADLFSGVVYLEGKPAPPGIPMVACVASCAEFETQPVLIAPEGRYQLLAIHPENRRLRGHAITFHIVNEYGRIQAQESMSFEGGFNSEVLDLHFDDPLPMPPPPPAPPALPHVGDPVIPLLPKLALALGTLTLAVGLILWAFRRAWAGST